MHRSTALRALLATTILFVCVSSVSAQSNNTADMYSFYRYCDAHYYKVTNDATSWYALTSQPLGRNWSGLAFHWQAMDGSQQWQEVVLSHKPLRNRWGFGAAIDRWQGTVNDLVVTPFVEYTSGDIALSAATPLGNSRGTAFGLVANLGDHYYAFATISPGAAPAWGLNWHNHAEHGLRFDVSFQDDTWKTRIGRAIDAHWGLELRTVSHGRSHTVGFGISFAH